ncbi:hypothetical protein DIPPA_06932 [Diplonema papillatum]|nr:hypothetical protein DIPPA_06932 [Diplonema papillatum]
MSAVVLVSALAVLATGEFCEGATSAGVAGAAKSALTAYRCPRAPSRRDAYQEQLGAALTAKVFGQHPAIAELTAAYGKWYNRWHAAPEKTVVVLQGGPGEGKTTVGKTVAEYHKKAAVVSCRYQSEDFIVSDINARATAAKSVIVLDDAEGVDLDFVLDRIEARTPFVLVVKGEPEEGEHAKRTPHPVIELARTTADAALDSLVDQMLLRRYCQSPASERPAAVYFAADAVRKFLVKHAERTSSLPSPHEIHRLLGTHIWPLIEAAPRSSDNAVTVVCDERQCTA